MVPTAYDVPPARAWSAPAASRARLDARCIMIVWDVDKDGRVTDVDFSLYDTFGNLVQDRIFGTSASPSANSYGVLQRGWMKGLPRMTPLSVFTGMIADGFASVGHFKAALRKFALLRQCAWAREMLGALPNYLG